jgi:hypothetical protein
MAANISTVAGRAVTIARKPREVKIRAAFSILLLILGVARSDAAEPKPVTLQAWDAYVQAVNLNTDERAAGRKPFLWLDESQDRIQRVRSGEMLVANFDPNKVIYGLIHHWIGAMFLPNVRLDQVMNVLDNYDRYTDVYKAFVVKSAVLRRTGDDETVRLLMVQRAFSVTAAVNVDNEIHITRLDANKICIASTAVRVQEIADYGQPSEHPFSDDRRPGYVWRTVGVTRLEQRDGGVYVEMETVALSRGIPFAFRLLIKPLTDKLPRKIMFETLKDTRDAVGAAGEPVRTLLP